MNGVHDLGGMHGFGPVEREENEPPFHGDWEAVVVAISNATRGGQILNIDEFRHGIERMDPAHYLGSSYYEHWLDGISRVLIEKGVLAAADLDARTEYFEQLPERPATAAIAGEPAPLRERVPSRGYVREATAPPRFAAGDAVRTRNINPTGHTRLARYLRGKPGVIHRLHGVHVFPDTNAHGQGEQPQPLYSVRFEAREVFGDAAEPNQEIYADLWESYLEADPGSR